METKDDSLLMQRGLRYLIQKFHAYRTPFLTAMICGLLAYGFTITNKLVNHDEVYTLFGKGGTLDLGRWGLKFIQAIFPNFSMPWIYGIITIFFIALSACVICRIFSLKSSLLQILVAGSIAVFPSLTATLAYMFTVSAYSVAFFAAVLAVYWMKNPTKKSVILAFLAMVGSLSLYQAYVALTASLLILLLVQQLLTGEKVSQVLRRGLGYVLFLAVSMGVYYLITQALLLLRGAGFSGYASNNLNLSLADIPGKIALAYTSFFQFFTQNLHGLIPTAFSQCLHFVMLAAALLSLVLWAIQQKKLDWGRILLLGLLLGLLPLSINCMYLFTTEDAVHTLVLYGFVAFYVLLALLVQVCLPLPFQKFKHRLRRVALELATLAMALSVAGNIYLANIVSLNLHLRYENAYAFYTALVADIQQMPQFDENTKLAVIGDYPNPMFYYVQFRSLENITGVTGFLPSDYSKERFLDFYLGFPIPFASDDEIDAIAQTEQFAQMPCYPYYGSMAFFGDTLVVKLSE